MENKVYNIIDSIIKTNLTRRKIRFDNIEYIKVNHEFDFLKQDVVDGYSGFIVRLIFYILGFDEHRLFRWRLENKHVQSLIYNNFVHNTLPSTIGMFELLNTKSKKDIDFFLNNSSEKYILKKTLTAGSKEGECENSIKNAPSIINNPKFN